jgi:hypothetical protein
MITAGMEPADDHGHAEGLGAVADHRPPRVGEHGKDVVVDRLLLLGAGDRQTDAIGASRVLVGELCGLVDRQ